MVATSPDGRRTVNAAGSALEIRDITSGVRVYREITRGAEITAVAACQSGSVVAAGTANGSVFIWSGADKRGLVFDIKTRRAMPRPIHIADITNGLCQMCFRIPNSRN